MSNWMEKLDAYANSWLAEANVPGAVIAVAKEGKLVYSGAFGFRDRERQLPVTLDTVFGIASVTKSFTCAAIMKLQEEGKLSVHDPVSRYLPEFRYFGETWSNGITLHHFMTHTAGIPPLPFLTGAMKRSLEQDPSIAGTEDEEELRHVDHLDTYEAVMKAIANYEGPPLASPGGAFSYCNDGYGLLGAVIERVSGQPYEQYLTEHILKPLGMTRTVFHLDQLEDRENTTTLYKRIKENGGERVAAAPLWHDAPAMRACGFLKSTARDLLAYLEMYRTLGEGKKSVLSSDSVREMIRPHVRVDGCRSYGYGLMVSPAFPDGALIEHSGSLKGVSSHVFALPEKGLTGVVLINVDGANSRELAAAILNLMADREPDALLCPIQPVELDSEQLEEYAGRYDSDEWIRLEVENRDGELFAKADGNAFPMIPVGKDSFVFKRGKSVVWLDFFRSADGKVERVCYSLRQLRKKAADLEQTV